MKHIKLSTARISFGLLFFFAFIAAIPVKAADLTVTVSNLRSEKGEILVELHDDSVRDDFLDADENVVEQRKQSATDPVFVFTDLEPGIYSVSLFHDENSNEALDKTLFGIPIEGHGFSNNASAPFGPPDFEATAFTISDGDSLQMNIDLRHLASRTSNGSGTNQNAEQMMQQMMAMFRNGDNGSGMDFAMMGETFAKAFRNGEEGDHPVFIGFAFANFGHNFCQPDQ